MKAGSNFVKAFFIFLLIFVSPWARADGNYRGTWKGESYDISLSDTFDNVRGSWGERRFDLSVSKTFQHVRGTLASDSVDLSFSKTFSHVRGNLPCGSVDYVYSETFRNVRGTLCGNNLDVQVPQGDSVSEAAREFFEDEIILSFPRPAAQAVRAFIRSRIEL